MKPALNGKHIFVKSASKHKKSQATRRANRSNVLSRTPETFASVEVIQGQYVVRYTLDGPKTLTELRRVLNQMAKGLFSEATKAAVRNLKERPTDFSIQMHVRLPIVGIEDP
jgi:sulfatase maturation enzyme AslB (radical SAM superfamily)